MIRVWQQLDGRMRLLAVVMILLGAVTVYQYAGMPLADLPTGDNIQAQERQLRELRKELGEEHAADLARAAIVDELRVALEPFWETGSKVPAVEVQKEFDRMARRAHIVIQTIGAPRTNKISDHVISVDINVRTTASMSDISRLLAEMARGKKPMYWRNCTLRPDNVRTPKKVVLSGRIQALVVSSEVHRIIGEPEGGS